MWTNVIQANFETKQRGNQLVLKVCPFCSNDNWNLEISIEKQIGHCWICDFGFTVRRFLQLNNLTVEIDAWQVSAKSVVSKQDVLLLDDFVLLSFKDYQKFLISRGLVEADVQRYSLMTTSKGKYKGKLIVPLYEGQKLVYIVTRGIYNSRYYNINIEKVSILPYYLNQQEHMYSDRYTLYLCEGVFDAFSINKLDFSVGVLLGTFISDLQIAKIEQFGFSSVVICLDSDAQRKVIKMYDKLKKRGIVTSAVLFDKGDDPNSVYVRDKELLRDKLLNPIVLSVQNKVKILLAHAN